MYFSLISFGLHTMTTYFSKLKSFTVKMFPTLQVVGLKKHTFTTLNAQFNPPTVLPFNTLCLPPI